MKLSVEEVRTLFDYDPETGELRWRNRPLRPGQERIDKGWNTRFAGKIAGRPDSHGHLYVAVCLECRAGSRNCSAHRIAWAHHYGEWPTFSIDHKNRNPADNRIDNLRPATQSQNLANASLRADNTSGHRGVYWRKKEKKWCAQIVWHGQTKVLGVFDTLEEAVACRRQASLRTFGEFSTEQDQGEI